MFALDLFNTRYERELNEGAVDNLEARRIENLNQQMQELLDRARTADAKTKAALKREFQKVKDERDSYYKIKDECMGYGTLVGEQGVAEGIFGSRSSPVLPVVDKIAKVASGLTPQNVKVGKQIIQNKASEITRMLSPQTKPGVDVIEQDVEEGWKSTLAGAALAGASMLGGAHAQNVDVGQVQALPAAVAQAKIDYNKPGPVTKDSMGQKLEYGIPVNAKGSFIPPNQDLPDNEYLQQLKAYKAWKADYLQRWPTATQAPDGSMQGVKPGLAAPTFEEGVAEGPESEYDIRQMLDKHDRDVEDLGIVGQGEHWAGIQQAKQRRVEKEKEQKKRKALDEETDPFGGYKQSPRAFGVGNFQRIVKANMGNLPTVTLEFADPNDNIVLDKKGIDLISDYYDGLKTDAIKNHFIYRVLPSADEVLTILQRLGWHDAVQPELPGIPRQGELPLQEKKRVDRSIDAGDVKVARELQKLRAQYPSARSDVEVVAKSEIDSNERSQQQLAAINGANTEQDQLLKQLVALDKKQGKEIGSLDNENDRLDQQLKHVEKTNAKLAQTISQMGKETSSKGADDAEPTRPKSVNLAPVDTPAQTQARREPSDTKPKSDAMSRMAQDLTQPRKVQGINSNPPPASIRFDEPGNVTDIAQHRANLTKQAQAAMKDKDFKPLAKQLVNKGVLSRTGTDEGLLDFVTKKQPATKTKPEPIDPMIAKIVSNRLNPQSRVPRAKAKVYHGYDEYNRAKAVGDVEESTVNEFAPSAGGGSGNYFQALASAWYNGAFDTGSLQKGIKSKEDVERLLNRGIVAPDGKIRKYAIDYNSDFDGVVISSDDYYEHADYNDQGQEVDSRTGQPWGPYDYMEFGDEQLDEGAPIAITPGSVDPGGAVDNFKQQMANNTEIAYKKGMAEAIPLDTLRSTAGTRVKDEVSAKLKQNGPLGRDAEKVKQNGKSVKPGVAEGLVDALKGSWEKVKNFDNPARSNSNTQRYQELRKRQELKRKQIQNQGVAEAGSPAQQAAIAINMKKHHKKPKGVAEGGYNDYDNNRKGFGRRGREDDEYHVPDPVETEYNIKVNGQVINRQPFANRAAAVAWAKQAVAAGKLDPKNAKLSPVNQVNELSNEKLGQYKQAAALDAGAADKRGDYDRADKRFSGIIKATKKQFANDVKKHQPTNEASSTSSDAVERAILNRIMTQHTDLLMKFGPDKVMQAAEEVAYNVGDVDEIGTSDVSAYVNQVKQILGAE